MTPYGQSSRRSLKIFFYMCALGCGGGATFRLEPQPPLPVGAHPIAQVLVDLDRDGDLDVVVPAFFGEEIWVLENDGRAGMSARAIPLLGNPVAIAAGDLDEDGWPDLAVALTAAGAVRILLGPDLRPGADVPLDNPGAVAIADLDGDGHLDLVGGRFEPGALRVLGGDGHGAFALRATLEAPAGVSCVQAADVDDDGVLDLLAVGSNADAVAIYPAGAAPPALVPTGDWPSWVTAVQLDEDPARELLVPANLGDRVEIVDQPLRTITAGRGPFAAAAGDLDEDDAPDIVVTNKFDDTLTVLLSSDDAPRTIPTGGGPTPVDLADLDSDGRLDIVIADGFSNDVIIYLGGHSPARIHP